MGGDPRKDAEVETVASGDFLEPTVGTGPSPAPSEEPALGEVNPDHYRVDPTGIWAVRCPQKCQF